MSKNNKLLSERDLIEYWDNFTGLESDDELDDSEDDEIDAGEGPSGISDFALPMNDEEHSSEEKLRTEMESEEEQVSDEEDNLPLSVLQGKQFTNKIPTNKNILWKQKSLQLNDDQLRFNGDTRLAADIGELEAPFDFFAYIFSNDLLEKIVQEKLAVQKKPERPPVFTKVGIKQYLGIMIYMSLVHTPNTRSFWSKNLRFSNIADCMPVNKFEKIRQFLHLNNNQTFIPRDQPGHDSLFKIRPLIDHLNKKFSTVAMEEHLSIDEQMCSTKVRHYMKQYMPMKPHKWGFKLFVLSGVSGFAYEFEIYTDQEKFEQLNEGEPNFGATSNIVLRLARIIPRQKNYKLYHDNYYTALPIMTYLARQGIYSLGTIRRNRLPNCKLPSECSLKKAPRGTSHKYVTTVDGVDISSLIWKDNKYVTLLSSFAGKNPVSSIKRFDRKQKKYIEVECPYVITEYNRHMGGVDLLDSLMGRYKISLKSRKWYMRLFYHLTDKRGKCAAAL